MDESPAESTRPGGAGITVRSVHRALSLLTLVSQEPRGLTALANAARLSLGTTSRLLATLRETGFVFHADDGSYRPGPSLARMAASAATWGAAEPRARGLVDRLHELIDETCVFFVRTGSEALCIVSRESGKPVRRVCPRGYVAQLHVGAAGKALSAFDPTADRWLPGFLAAVGDFPLASGAVRTREELVAEFEQIRRDGFAVSVRESTAESWAVAAPVYVEQELLGVLSAAIPISRFDEAYLQTVADAVLAVTRESTG